MAMVLDASGKTFFSFVASLLAGVDPDELEIPECGPWQSLAEIYHYKYSQNSVFGLETAGKRLRKMIEQEMKEDPQMHLLLGSLFSDAKEEIDEEEAEDNGVKQLLKHYDFPALQPMTWNYKDGRPSFTVDPRMPAHLGKQSGKFIDEFVEWAEQYAKWSHPLILRATAVWILSLVAARRIYMDIEGGKHTPFYILVCAKSTEYAKSSGVHMGMALLKKAGLHWLLVPDSMTPPMFMMESKPDVPEDYDTLSDMEKEAEDFKQRYAGKFSIFFDEMGDMLTSMLQPNGTYAPYLKWMLKLDNSPDELSYYTVKNSRRSLKDPYMTFLGCMTVDDYLKIPKGSANPIKRGFIPRAVMITPPRRSEPNLEVTNLKKPNIPENLVKSLLEFHKNLGKPDIRYVDKGGTKKAEVVSFPEKEAVITKEVKQAYERYVQAIQIMIKKDMVPEDLHACYVRLPVKTMRLAALLAWESNGGIITEEEWARALIETEEWRKSLHEFFRQISNDPGEVTEGRKAEDRLLEIMKGKRFGGWIRAWEAAGALHVDAKKARDMLEALRLAGAIEFIEINAANGRRTPLYYDPTCSAPKRYAKAIADGEIAKSKTSKVEV